MRERKEEGGIQVREGKVKVRGRGVEGRMMEERWGGDKWKGERR